MARIIVKPSGLQGRMMAMDQLLMTVLHKGRAWAIVILLAAIQRLNQIDKLVVGFAARPSWRNCT